jgi:GT2 family glycosyltransferase
MREAGDGWTLSAGSGLPAWSGKAAGRPRRVSPRVGSARSEARPCVRGKAIFAGDRKLLVRGATYGAFRPDEHGNEFHDPQLIGRDLALMAANGMNAVRIPHTTPPRALLDLAQRHGLRVMVGLSAEQQIGFWIDGKRREARDGEEALRARVRACAGHPALLCYGLGNEIPAPIVRWYGRRRVERFLEQMHRIVREEDPDGLVTYVNYPTTEYLELPFLDLLCFNVYLESQPRLAAYLARLQNVAGDRPLIMGELGLDSLRHGELAQARALAWQVRTAFAAGCAGAFVFSWTDEWYRGGADVDDWKFGLTDGRRRPKPALASVRQAFAQAPFQADRSWPRVSVIVCSYNGSRTIRDCCEGLRQLEYPDFEVIVVDDGSTDATAAIAEGYGFRVVRTENRGLSSARNTGLAAATGEIVAYLDDDAYPDPHWLGYLAETFARTDHAGVGGPNLTPAEDGPIAQCVARSPGNPTHVLLTDGEAEHIPGCNMAFRRSALEAIGGFDPRFRAAGDDVDVCWRLRERGFTLGFSPAATVWHHRRSSVSAYLKQQVGYGRAEGLLAEKWREQHGRFGHWSWQGRIYAAASAGTASLRRPRVYHGVWGQAPFQALYERAPSTLLSLPRMPEFYLIVLALLGCSALGALWRPLRLALPLLALSLGVLVWGAVARALFAARSTSLGSRLRGRRWVALVAFLHLVQPVARLWGRLRDGRAAVRRAGARGFRVPRPRTAWVWSATWQAPELWLESFEALLRAQGARVARGGSWDAWDLELGGPWLVSLRACVAAEDGRGGQLIRFRAWPRVAPPALVTTASTLLLAGLAAWDGAWIASAVLGSAAAMLSFLIVAASGAASAAYVRALEAIARSARGSAG